MKLLLLTYDGGIPDELVELVARRGGETDVSVRVVVPVQPVPDAWTWDERATRAAMLARMDEAIDRLRRTGAHVEGTVGIDRDAMVCVNWLLDREAFDEVAVAGCPPGRARWLRMDLAARMRRAFGIPVTHVVPGSQPSAA